MTIGFIGAGNMGGTLAAAVAKTAGDNRILLADKDTAKTETLADAIGAAVVSNETAAAESDLLFLGVKPHLVEGVLRELSPSLAANPHKPVLVSMAAGVALDRLTAALPAGMPVIRIMPNTPAAVGAGVILYAAGNTVSPEQVAAFTACLAAAGRVCPLEERLIDAASAVSGCGPAFVYLFIEALADGGVECGLPRDLALTLAAETVGGAAAMVAQTGRHPGELKDAVCSPGGTTIAGVHALEDGGFRSLAMDAVTAAYEKTLLLAGK